MLDNPVMVVPLSAHKRGGGGMVSAVRCAIALVTVLITGAASAKDLVLTTAVAEDGFLNALVQSKELRSVDLQIAVKRVGREEEALDLTLNGKTELGLFGFSVLKLRQLPNKPTLYTAFTRPFLFESGEDVFNLQNSGFGDAVLADLRRGGFIPLSFWNRGLSQIVARVPMDNVDIYRGRRVSVSRSARRDVTTPILTSLGAETTNADITVDSDEMAATVVVPGEGALSVFRSRRVSNNAASNSTRDQVLYATDFQPIVGVLAASERAWHKLSEREKQGLQRAIDEATQRSLELVKANEDAFARQTNLTFQSLTRDHRRELVLTSASDIDVALKDLAMVDEAKGLLTVVAQQSADGKKK